MAETRKSRSSDQSAGSSPSGEPEFLVVGKLRHPHGLKGEIMMDIITDFPERLKPGTAVFAGDEHRPLRIRSHRPHARGLLVGFDGMDTPEEVGVLRNMYLYVPAADRPPLPEGEYYHHQLLGLRVVSDEGQELGSLVEILNTGANDIYVIRSPQGREILLPAIESVLLAVDLQQREIRVHLLPGLLD
jgi:16S rRNA processing protein RimM